jgi:hypothetical protein
MVEPYLDAAGLPGVPAPGGDVPAHPYVTSRCDHGLSRASTA